MVPDKSIFEIIIHGRGGQGAKTAAQIIVEAALERGKHIQAFPEYGPERSGAPVKTFARISDRPITTSQPITDPDVVMVIDPTLLDSVDVNHGTGENSVLIVNSDEPASEIKERTGFKGKVYCIGATRISMKTLGISMPNTSMLGAFVKLTGVVDLDSVLKKVENMFLRKIGPEKTNANMECIRQAYEEAKP